MLKSNVKNWNVLVFDIFENLFHGYLRRLWVKYKVKKKKKGIEKEKRKIIFTKNMSGINNNFCRGKLRLKFLRHGFRKILIRLVTHKYLREHCTKKKKKWVGSWFPHKFRLFSPLLTSLFHEHSHRVFGALLYTISESCDTDFADQVVYKPWVLSVSSEVLVPIQQTTCFCYISL